jgi:hypothetical protein
MRSNTTRVQDLPPPFTTFLGRGDPSTGGTDFG